MPWNVLLMQSAVSFIACISFGLEKELESLYGTTCFSFETKKSVCAHCIFPPKYYLHGSHLILRNCVLSCDKSGRKRTKYPTYAQKFLILTIRKEIQRGYYLPWFSHIESNGNNFWRERVTVVERARFRQYFNWFFFFQILFFNQPVRAQFKI